MSLITICIISYYTVLFIALIWSLFYNYSELFLLYSMFRTKAFYIVSTSENILEDVLFSYYA